MKILPLTNKERLKGVTKKPTKKIRSKNRQQKKYLRKNGIQLKKQQYLKQLRTFKKQKYKHKKYLKQSV